MDYTLTISPAPPVGSLQSNSFAQNSIMCGAHTGANAYSFAYWSRCSVTAPSGTVIVLQYVPIPGYNNHTFGGACSGTSTDCRVTLDANKTVSLTSPTATLTVSPAPPPSQGSVIFNAPDGQSSWSCGTVCAGLYDQGDQGSIIAKPAWGYMFDAWTGICARQGSQCYPVLNANSVVSVSFKPARFQILATRPTGGSIEVSGSSDGAPRLVSCGDQCGAPFDNGKVVTVTASRIPGYAFASWSGACAGQGNPCSLTVDAEKNVSATFTKLPPVTLSATRPAAGGSITTPGTSVGTYKLDCGTTCAVSYEVGDVVRVDANLLSDVYAFSGWLEGTSCAGQGNPCTLTMTTNASVAATYRTFGTTRR